MQASYLSRYGDYQPEAADGMFMIKPKTVLAWQQFPADVTRFSFG